MAQPQPLLAPPPSSGPPLIYKATYSGVPVYEFMCNNVAVMRRKSDAYLNATQILKVAEFDKPQRTRILEREVQIGQHEKVQGGYGKYQGTWVPFERGVALAEHYHVDDLLRPIFDFVQGDKSPPLAPKHVTAASTRPRKPRLSNSEPKRKKVLVKSMEEKHDINHLMQYPPPAPLAPTLMPPLPPSAPVLFDTDSDEDTSDPSYAHQLLQYFISDDTGIPSLLLRPPMDLDVNVIIDDEGHTSLHWAAAMGRLKLVSILCDLGADIYRVNYKGQTALMRSVLFTNNFDAKSFMFLIDLLKKTVFNIDKKDQTVFHHVAATASWKGKVHASRYYMECLIQTLAGSPSELISILNVQDVYGDTALSIAARIGNKKLVRLLMDAGASPEIANEEGLTAQDYLSEMSCVPELPSRTKLRQSVEGLFKHIIVNDHAQPSLSSQIFDSFAGNYERELIQRDHLIRDKRHELDMAKKRLAGIRHTWEQIQYNPDQLSRVEQEAHQQAMLLFKQQLIIQRQTLENLMLDYNKEQDMSGQQQELARLTHQLDQLKQKRRQQTQILMERRLQTPSRRHQEYKRLISMCCNVPYENVDMMLLPLLSSFDELSRSIE
ncbi:hypothetical protein CU098_003450 [Rhizopus stolonifer]|uniref:HTH APSES-type domain-containing protein n=1 Tax=Rhizopus stolonifer TaxID=4846 RepID=A0A367K8U2_RHIST|nr:hypothetical protein CU098_003450 [Rhizopus stolonifer]